MVSSAAVAMAERGSPIEQAISPKKFPESMKAERVLIAAVTELGNLDGALADEIKRPARITFAKDHLAFVQADNPQLVGNVFQDLRSDALKKPIVGEVIERFDSLRRGAHLVYRAKVRLPPGSA